MRASRLGIAALAVVLLGGCYDLTDDTQPGGPTYSLTPLSGAPVVAGDDAGTVVTAGFNLRLFPGNGTYGVTGTQLLASTNGYLLTDLGGEVTSTTTACPQSTSEIGDGSGRFEVLLDDLTTEVRAATTGQAPNRTFTVEWSGTHDASGDPVLFQARFFEGIDTVEYHYAAIDGSAGTTATVGATWNAADSSLGSDEVDIYSCDGGGPGTLAAGRAVQLHHTSLSVHATAPNAVEAGPSGAFTFTRTGDNSAPMDASYSVGGTATPVDDYAALSGSVAFAAGQSSVTVPVLPVDDDVPEGDETVVVTIVTAPLSFSSQPATVTISDEPVPSTTLAVSATVATAVEGGDPGVFTFTRSGSTVDSLTVGYQVSGSATAGDDYAPFGLVSFQPGQSSVTKQVVAVDDGVEEPDESVIVTLLDGSDYDVAPPISATVMITDAVPEPEPTDPCDEAADPGFTDVPVSNVHAEAIACLGGLGYAQGGPGGRPADEYGPRLRTTRAQMASFIARIAEDLGVELPADPDDAFEDDDESVHELRINQLAAVGIIGGNGEDGSSFRPGEVISREEMASFLNGLIEAVTGTRIVSDVDAFTDDDDSPYEADIDGLASVGIVEGTGGGLYDPDGTVQRDSMASFLVRTIQYLAEAEPPAEG